MWMERIPIPTALLSERQTFDLLPLYIVVKKSAIFFLVYFSISENPMGNCVDVHCKLRASLEIVQ